MATASLAVPKSVMKTMVGGEGEAAWAVPDDAGCRVQATLRRASATTTTANRRVGDSISLLENRKYTYEGGLMPVPSELAAKRFAGRRRRNGRGASRGAQSRIS